MTTSANRAKPTTKGKVNGAPGKQAQQSAAARQTLCAATLWCLDHYGYADTSISRIIERAGVSRGALTHHYPSKEDLIVDAIEGVLKRRQTLRWPSLDNRDDSVPRHDLVVQDILWNWRQLNTPQGRALLEVIVAARTDATLQGRIGEQLKDWNTLSRRVIIDESRLPHVDPKHLELAWDLIRVFYRGLQVHQNFEPDDSHIHHLAEAFAKLIAQLFTRP